MQTSGEDVLGLQAGRRHGSSTFLQGNAPRENFETVDRKHGFMHLRAQTSLVISKTRAGIYMNCGQNFGD